MTKQGNSLLLFVLIKIVIFNYYYHLHCSYSYMHYNYCKLIKSCLFTVHFLVSFVLLFPPIPPYLTY